MCKGRSGSTLQELLHSTCYELLFRRLATEPWGVFRRGIMPQLALRAVPMAGMDVMARSWWRCQQFSTLMMLMFVWSLQPFEIFQALLSTESTESTGVCELHRRLPGDVTLPNDTRFIDWVAVVYSCWADLAGLGRSNGHQWFFIPLQLIVQLSHVVPYFPMFSHVFPCCPMLSQGSPSRQ